MNKKYLLGLIALFIVITTINKYDLFRNQSETLDVSEVSTTESSEIGDELIDIASQSKEELYSILHTYASNPQLITQATIFEQPITFVAEMRGESMEIESTDTTLAGKSYVAVYLLREQSTPIYLNISMIERKSWPQDGDLLRITGVPTGYLYAVHENQRINILDIEAVSIEQQTSTTNVTAEKIIETNEYKITIADTEILYDAFDNQTMIIYYTFKNKKASIAASPIKTYFFFSQGGEQLTHTVLADHNEALDPSALSIELLEPGTELLYYSALKLIKLDMPVEMRVYDDEYTLLNKQSLKLSEAK
ncbi:DUF5067 domain-containing protein [uncultured Enterococcus sp.]|uniref:DUF5067 domain-containing protein n=1 Tax=uncultured Enterococcus sp. TaxID=167972 RepID=UPI002AA93F7F|nr:DUF5067 domain-containing protein [uncultured Enterococcus sp.]